MNQIAINSKLTLFILNVGYNTAGTHSNFGNVFFLKIRFKYVLSIHCTLEFPNIDERKKTKIP
jgi:hypothetical protein